MSAPNRLEGMATIVPTIDIPASVAFYVDVLDFSLAFRNGDEYALMSKDAAGIMLLGGKDGDYLAPEAKNLACYIWVQDVDAYFVAQEQKLIALPEGRLRPPFDRDYGTREFHVIDPNGLLIFFGMNRGE